MEEFFIFMVYSLSSLPLRWLGPHPPGVDLPACGREIGMSSNKTDMSVEDFAQALEDAYAVPEPEVLAADILDNPEPLLTALAEVGVLETGKAEALDRIEAEIENDPDHSIIGIARIRRLIKGTDRPRRRRESVES